MKLQIDNDHIINNICQIWQAFDKSSSDKIYICYRIIIIGLLHNFFKILNIKSFKAEIKKINKVIIISF